MGKKARATEVDFALGQKNVDSELNFLEIGYGINEKRNVLEVRKESGALVAPTQTIDNIATTGLKALATMEYVDPNIIVKAPVDGKITIDLKRERYIVTTPLKDEITIIETINQRGGLRGILFVRQDEVGGRQIKLMGPRFVWKTQRYEEIQPNPNPNWVTMYEWFVFNSLTIYVRRIDEFLYNELLAVDGEGDTLALDANKETELII